MASNLQPIHDYVNALAHSLGQFRKDPSIVVSWPTQPEEMSSSKHLEEYFESMVMDESDDKAIRSMLTDPHFFPNTQQFRNFYGSHAEDMAELWNQPNKLWAFWYHRSKLGFRCGDFLQLFLEALVQHSSATVQLTTSLVDHLIQLPSLHFLCTDVVHLVASYGRIRGPDLAMARLIVWYKFVNNDMITCNDRGNAMVQNTFWGYLSGDTSRNIPFTGPFIETCFYAMMEGTKLSESSISRLVTELASLRRQI